MLPMLRGTFFSIGMFITLWGVSLLFVDKLVLNMPDEVAAGPRASGTVSGQPTAAEAARDRSTGMGRLQLALGGAVTMLYAIALPKKS